MKLLLKNQKDAIEQKQKGGHGLKNKVTNILKSRHRFIEA